MRGVGVVCVLILAFFVPGQPHSRQNAEKTKGEINNVRGAGGEKFLAVFFQRGENDQDDDRYRHGQASKPERFWEGASYQKGHQAVKEEVPDLVAAWKVINAS